MSQFRKKSVVIEAVQLVDQDHDGENMVVVADWISDGGYHVDQGPHTLAIATLEGVMVAGHGDWIIRGVKGEFYPVKPEIFAETYEQVADAP